MLSSGVETRSMRRRFEILAPLLLAALAAFLLLWRLSEPYLWQDEANTAVLATRMLQYGRPLAYDGVNFIGIDHITAEDTATFDQRTGDPHTALDYDIRRGDFQPDFAWKWQPWGLFTVAAAGLKLIGHTTLGARLPFAIAAFFAVLPLYRLARRYCGSVLLASLAALLLLLNAYWILHSRQCRYYPLSSLLLLLTLLAYMRWQSGRRWGAAAFVLSAWCWFQVDFGTVWPVFAVLFVAAFLTRAHSFGRTTGVGAVLAAVLAPFVIYYGLWSRRSVQAGDWTERFHGNLFNMNQYIVPAVVVVLAAALLAQRWKSIAAEERRLVGIACAIVIAHTLWVPTATPEAFLRYIIMMAPLGALLSAWLAVRVCGPRWAWLGAAVLALTPWLSLPLHLLVPPPDWYTGSLLVRSELGYARDDIFGHRSDPNGLVIEWLRRNAAPTDQILINYEDIPLMFYLPNPIRGGIAAFRVEDDSHGSPAYAILRRSAGFVYWPPYEREIARHQWSVEPVTIPDLTWGNNPDPMAQGENPSEAPPIWIARLIR